MDHLSTLPSPGWCFETAWEPLNSFAAVERKHVFSASSRPAVTTAAAVLPQPQHLELGLAAIMVGLQRSCDRVEVCDVLEDCPLPWLVVTAREGSWVGNAHEISGISLDVGAPACCDHSRVTLCCSGYTRGDCMVWSHHFSWVGNVYTYRGL